MDFYKYIKNSLGEIKEQNLYREFKVLSYKPGAYCKYGDKKILQMSSNNYLGLAGDSRLAEAAIKAVEKYGTGSTGSRLITGTHELHIRLEEKIAKLKGTESALVFSTGYAANLGGISALFGEHDAVYSDELNHASIIDGIKLSKTNKFIYKHSDMQHLEDLLEKNHHKYRFNIIITDSIFSMDGDRAPLKKIVELKEKYGAILFLDEAHAFGVFGEKGQGLAHELGLNHKIDIQMGTLSKAAGSEGGYIAGKREIIEFINNRARSFIFSTAPSIPAIAASIRAVEIIDQDFALRKRLHENISYFKSLLTRENIEFLPSDSAIFCIRFESVGRTLYISQKLLQDYKIMASAIRPPTVKDPRIRLCIMALHSKEDLDHAVRSLKRLLNY